MGLFSSSATAHKTYSFTAVISPNSKPGEQVYEISGKFTLDRGDTVADVKKSLMSGYGRRAMLVSFTYH